MTSPAPALSAPWATSAAAPVFPLEPASIKRCPNVPLWPADGLGRSMALNDFSSNNSVLISASVTAVSGMPISTMWSSPTYSVPGCRTSPSLARAMVAVRSARIAVPRGSPVSVDNPEGISTATMGAGLAFAISMHRANIPVTSLIRPVPKMASTIRPDFSTVSDMVEREPESRHSVIGSPSFFTIL